VNRAIIGCASCGQPLPVPISPGTLMIRCPKCGHKWERSWPSSGYFEPLPCNGPVIDIAPIVAQVTAICRPRTSLQLEELWEAICIACVEQIGVRPSPGLGIAIELAVVEQRANEYVAPAWQPASRGTFGEPSVPWASWRGGGSPYVVHEDTTPWQDNAIRALEGD
jgi:hypothetical protein